MKKRIVALALIVMLALTLAACGSSTGTTEKVIDTIDKYLDGKISANKAISKLDKEKEKLDEDKDSSTDKVLIDANITSVRWELVQMDLDGTGDRNKIIEDRNDIADLAGLEKRK